VVLMALKFISVTKAVKRNSAAKYKLGCFIEIMHIANIIITLTRVFE